MATLAAVGAPSKFTDAQKAKAVDLLNRLGPSAAAAQVGVTVKTLYNWRNSGLGSSTPVRHRPGRRPRVVPVESCSVPPLPAPSDGLVLVRASCCGERVPVVSPTSKSSAAGRANRREALILHFVTSPGCEAILRRSRRSLARR